MICRDTWCKPSCSSRPAALFLTSQHPPEPVDSPLYWVSREAGFRSFVAPWCCAGVRGGQTLFCGGFEALPDGRKRTLVRGERISPALIFNRGGMCDAWERLFNRLAEAHPEAWLSYHPELRFLGTKWGAEVCLRQAEQRGIHIPRPETFLVPKHEIRATLKKIGRRHPLIFKPAEGSQGRGIRVSTPDNFDAVVNEVENASSPRFVVQRIVDNAIRLDGKRFDIRIYTLVTSFRPLRYEIYAGGMARIAAKPSGSGIPIDLLSTITNCDFRSRNGAPVENLTIPQLLSALRAQGYAVNDFWLKVETLVEDVFRCFAGWERLVAAPECSRHFLVAGFDMLLAHAQDGIEPLFLESNHASPPIKEYGPPEVDEGLWLTNRRWLTALLNGGVPATEEAGPREPSGPLKKAGRRRSTCARPIGPQAAGSSAIPGRTAARHQEISLPRQDVDRTFPSIVDLVKQLGNGRGGEIVLNEASRVLNNVEGRQKLLQEVGALLSGKEAVTIRASDDRLTGLKLRICRDGGDSVLDFAIEPNADLRALRYPLAAVLPSLGEDSWTVETEPWPGAKFEFLHRRLVGPSMASQTETREELLLRYLGRIITGEHSGDPLGKRFIEPGVGRSALVDFLRIEGRPDIVDFSVLGIGSTRYCEGGFYLRGIHIDGLNSLKRAVHRKSSAARLEEAGCRVPHPVAIISLPGLKNIMPDGRIALAAILVRGFRTVLRVHQLDPLCAFLNSDRHRNLVTSFLNKLRNMDISQGSRPRAGLARNRERSLAPLAELPSQGDVQADCMCRCPSYIVRSQLAEKCATGRRSSHRREDWTARLRLAQTYAPLLLDIAKARVARELGRDPESEGLSNEEYVTWFAARMGEQLGLMKKLRFLHEYRLARGREMTRVHSLVETNVTLLAEFADLDTSVFVDRPDSSTLDTLGIAKELFRRLQDGFEEFHAVDVERTAGILHTLAFLACRGDAAVAKQAVDHFAQTYQKHAGRYQVALGWRP